MWHDDSADLATIAEVMGRLEQTRGDQEAHDRARAAADHASHLLDQGVPLPRTFAWVRALPSADTRP